MKRFNVFRRLSVAALAIPLLFMAEAAMGHGSGGGHGTGSSAGSSGGHGTGGSGTSGTNGGHGTASGTHGAQGTAGGHGTVAAQGKGGHQAFLAHQSPQETGDMRFSHEEHNEHFSHQHRQFATGGPSNLPYSYEYGTYDYRFWQDLAMKVQSGLARQGYYRGPIDGVVGSGSRQAIRAFQEKEGLPVTGLIDPNVLRALELPIPQASPRFSFEGY